MRVAILTIVLLISCSDGGGGEAAAVDADTGAGADSALADDAGVACTAHSLPREIDIDFDGDTRKVFLAGPTEMPASPVPLVLNFHGYSDGGIFQENLSLMSEHAVAKGYVVAYPEGTGLLKGWNAGTCCGTAASLAKKDVEFTERVIEEVAALACVDLSKVYAIGYSNGAFLSHRLACERSETIAGIAPVAGVMGMESCEPTRAIPVLQIHGTGDLVVSYDGNQALGFPSVATSMADWSARLHCDATEPSVFYEAGDALCVRYSGCEAPLGLCTIDGGGHTWPGGTFAVGRGKVSADLDANEMIMQFFQDAL